MKKYFWFLLLNAFLLSACFSPISQPIQAMEPSQTVSPTMILIPQPTKTPTLDPDQIVTATVQALSSGCTLGSEFSPDKAWVAIKCSDVKINHSDEAGTTLNIVNLSSYQQWIVTYHQIYGAREIEAVGGMSEGAIFVEHWSADKNYLYIGVMPNVYTEFEFNRTAALFRLDLKTGETTEILGAEEVQKTFYDYSISPAESKIAFIKLLKSPLQVEIKNFASAETEAIQLDPSFSTAGSIVWSQDSNNLIFLAVDYNNDAPFVFTTVFQWDDQENRLKEIAKLTDRLFFIVKWDEESKRIILRDYFEEEFFELDTISRQLTPVSP